MKPEWAQGPEWDGWRSVEKRNCVVKTVHLQRDGGGVYSICICGGGSYWAPIIHIVGYACAGACIEQIDDAGDCKPCIDIPVKSPEHARVAAEALLEAME